MKELIYGGIKKELKAWKKMFLRSFLWPLIVNVLVTFILVIIIYFISQRYQI